MINIIVIKGKNMNYQIKFVKDKIKSLVNKNKQLDNEIQNTTSGDVKAVKKKQKADNNNELRKSRTEKYEMEEIQEDVRFMKKSCMLLQKLGLIKSQYQFCNEYLKRTKHYLSMLLTENRHPSIDSISCLVKKLMDNLDCSTHFGRRNYITSLLTNGIDITTVKTLVNHSNIQTTAIYYNENENMLKNVVNQLHI